MATDIFGDPIAPPAPSRNQRIADVYEANGSRMTIRNLAQACITAGVWTTGEIERFALRSIQEQCRRVLHEKDAEGLPKSGQTCERDDDGQPVWQARFLWDFADYALNVREHVEQRNENHAIAVKLADECEARYGAAIAIPELSETE